MLNIPELIKEHHQAMIEAGFYDCPECGGSGETMKMVCYGYSPIEKIEDCETCNGSGVDPNKNIGELLMLIVSELSEALEAHRNNKKCTNYIINDFIVQLNNIPESRYILLFEHYIKDTFEDEIADVFLRLFDLCGYLKIEILEDYGVLGKVENVAESLLLITESLIFFHQDWLISKKTINLNTAYGCLMWLCRGLNIPIEKHIIAKMAYNKTREHKHGKAY